MRTAGRALQVATAWGGFLCGYLWAAHRWGEARGLANALVFGREVAQWGLLVASIYVVLLAALFWPLVPVPRTTGLRTVAFPTAFTLSFLLAAAGVSWALRAVG